MSAVALRGDVHAARALTGRDAARVELGARRRGERLARFCFGVDGPLPFLGAPALASSGTTSLPLDRAAAVLREDESESVVSADGRAAWTIR